MDLDNGVATIIALGVELEDVAIDVERAGFRALIVVLTVATILKGLAPDDQVTVGVNRNGETLTVVLRLGARES